MIDASDVTAVIITRGDVPELMEERQAQYETLGMPCIIVESPDIFTRYETAARFAKTTAVFFQDDDVALTNEQILALLDNYAPGILVANMYDDWIASMGYFDLALVGLGAVCDNRLWEDAFARYLAAYGEDDGLIWDADFIFGVLARWRRFDIDAASAILPEASNENRLWRKPGQHERKYETITKARKLRTVVLTMLTKNEEENILRALSSSAEWWDSLLLLDTGSTDDTMRLAQQFCEEKNKDITIIESEFRDFSSARSLLLQEGRWLGDYMLLQDADEEWTNVPDRPELWADAYMLHYEGSVDYAQPRLISSRFPWKWTGPIHAYLDSDWDGECIAVNMPQPLIVHHGDARHDTTRDIEILEAEIASTDYDLPRNLFLLGKAYDGSLEFDKAIEIYQRRVDLGHLDAEDYWCRLRLGNLAAEHLNDFARAVDTLWEAHKTRPQRNEALRALAFYCTAVADATPYPEDDITLVLRDHYRVG